MQNYLTSHLFASIYCVELLQWHLILFLKFEFLIKEGTNICNIDIVSKIWIFHEIKLQYKTLFPLCLWLLANSSSLQYLVWVSNKLNSCMWQKNTPGRVLVIVIISREIPAINGGFTLTFNVPRVVHLKVFMQCLF